MKLDKNKKLALFITILTLLVLGGITYTFFAVSVSNTNNEKLTTQTATMSLEFDDNDNGVNASLNLGQSIVKKFTLENTGTVDAYGKINWYNLVNIYTEDSLTWTLEQSTTENGTYTVVGSGKVPTSTSAVTEELKNGLLVPVNITYYYKLTITLNNLDVDQSSDINASMHSQFSLESGSISGVEQILSSVSNYPKNSTDVINIPRYVTKNAYVFRFNGIVNSPDDWEYDNLEDCQDVMEWFKEEFGSSINAMCQINPSTEKYNIYVTGLSNKIRDEYYVFDTMEDCEYMIEDESFENTTCEMAEVEAPIDEPTGCTNTLAYDGTVDNNLRYVGANPCNYVTFNGETAGWRIVGVMNNVDDGAGNLETRIKLVRSASLGGYSWDTSAAEVNEGYGINDWTQADLMRELNGDYLDLNLTENTNWYNDLNNQKTRVFDITKRLNNSALNKIGDAKWFLGGSTGREATISEFYTNERGTKVWGSEAGQTCEDAACPRATEWTGKVALMYPSDYGFAMGGEDRNLCLSYGNFGRTFCSFNWLLYQYENSWLITPSSNFGYKSLLSFTSFNSEYTSKAETYEPYRQLISVYPSVYLKPAVSITDGDGSESNPYIIS